MRENQQEKNHFIGMFVLFFLSLFLIFLIYFWLPSAISFYGGIVYKISQSF